MRLGVSAWRLTGQRLGIGRYIEYLLSYWNEQLHDDDEVTVFVAEDQGDAFSHLSEKFHFQVIRPKLKNAVWENVLLPRHTRNIDVLFGPSYTLPLIYRGKSVAAIHSVDEVERGHFPWWYSLTYGLKYRLTCHTADVVVVNSRSVGERVREHYAVPEEKIEVIWLGADDVFQRREDPERDRETRLKYLGVDAPYILFVGGMSVRRNAPMLMRAFSRLKKRDGIPHHLLFVGPNRGNHPLAELARELGIEDSMVHTIGRFEHHSELVPIYNAAEVYVMPSASEGFLLTLAEALACGTPVITTSTSALGEVANGYALTIDKPDEDALVDAMSQVLSSAELRADLRRKALERAPELRWRLTAQKTLDLLRRVAES